MSALQPSRATMADRPARHRFRISDLLDDGSDAFDSLQMSSHLLRTKARWIRDELDPEIAREGPSYLNAGHLVILVKFLDNLAKARISIAQLKCSRIHFAVLIIAARATRWPGALIEEADKIIEHWTIRFGPLTDIHGALYEQGGRLHNICLPADIDKEVLEIKWLRAPESKTRNGYARQHGAVGCSPGDWWLNSMFAHHAGMLDTGDPTGRIICDKHGAYALLLTDGDEQNDSDPHEFVYPAKSTDPGRYRLTSASPDSRTPIRVLRSHTLRNCWAPKAGIRYDGLYRVVGWSIKSDKSGAFNYNITFRRLPTESSMQYVLMRPWADEVDDYHEYKRLRQLERNSRNAFRRAGPLLAPPVSGRAGPSAANETSLEPKENITLERPRSTIMSNDLGPTVIVSMPEEVKT